MTHTKAEIIGALHIIKDTCVEMPDCIECPFDNEHDCIFFKEIAPADWDIAVEDAHWRAVKEI